jgi:hypothetical protein
MKPLYDLRISDLHDQDVVCVTCQCGHVGEATGLQIRSTRKPIPPNTWITGKLGVTHHLKCQGCGERGRAVWVTVRRFVA